MLAGILTGMLEGKAPEENIRFACGMGSLVAMYRGATPVITTDNVNTFLRVCG